MMHSLDILWQDESAVAVNKPSGLLVHNSRWAGPKERSLRQILADQIGGPVYVVHRLDRPTSGALLFARSREAARAWHEALAASETVKIYLALVRGHLSEPVMVDHAFKVDGKLRDARSQVTPLLNSSVERCALVAVRLFTGRRHQARRHLKHISHPVLGDTTHGQGSLNRYYRAEYGLHRLALHAWRLNVRHPLRDEQVQIEAPIPEDLTSVLRRLFPGEGEGVWKREDA